MTIYGNRDFHINGIRINVNEIIPRSSTPKPIFESRENNSQPFNSSEFRKQVEDIRASVNATNLFTNVCETINKKVLLLVQQFIADVEGLRMVAGSINVDRALVVLNLYKTFPLQCELNFPSVEIQLDRLETYAIQRVEFVKQKFCASGSILLKTSLKFATNIFNDFPEFLIYFSQKQIQEFETKLNSKRTSNLKLIKMKSTVDKRIKVEDFEKAFNELENSFSQIESDYTAYANKNKLSCAKFKDDSVGNFCLHSRKRRNN